MLPLSVLPPVTMIDGRSLGANEHFLSHKLPFRVSRLAMALKGHTVYNSVVENATFSSAPVDSVTSPKTRQFPPPAANFNRASRQTAAPGTVSFRCTSWGFRVESLKDERASADSASRPGRLQRLPASLATSSKASLHLSA